MHRVVDERNAFQLNEYQGTYELVAGNVRDDKFSMNWSIASRYDDEIGGGAPVMRDDKKYMNIPVKVILGDREHAIENLEWLLGELEGHVAEVPLSAEKSEENVPF